MNPMNSRQNVSEHSTFGRDSLWLASVALIYFVAARLSLSLVLHPEGIAVIWPPSGIFLSSILLTRRELRPCLVGVLFITDLIAEMITGTPFFVSVIYALSLTGEAVFSTWLLLRFVGDPFTFSKVRDVFGFFVLSVLFSNAILSLVAAAASGFLLETSFWSSWKWWATSDGIGNLLVTPFILSWAALPKTTFDHMHSKRIIEGSGLLLFLLIVNLTAFGPLSGNSQLSLLNTYLLFPLLLWATFRFGMCGVTSVLIILAAFAIRHAAAGRAPGVPLYNFQLDTVISVQLYLAIVAAPLFFLAAALGERKQTGRMLQESEDLFRHVFEAANVGKSITLPAGEISVNKAFAEMLGYSKEELAHKTWQDLTPPDEVETIQRRLASLLNGEQDSARFSKRYIHKNGSHVWGDVSVAILRDAEGRTVHFITTIVDITERIQTEEKLKLSEERFSSAFHSGPAGLTITRIADGKFIDVNRSFLKMFEFSREKVIGKNSTGLKMLAPQERDKLIQKQLESGGLHNAELQARSKSGRIMNILFSSNPMELEGEAYHITTMIDITDRKLAENALQSSKDLLQSIVDNTPALVYVFDRNKHVLIANKALGDLIGLPVSEIIGKRRNEFMPREIADRDEENDLRVIEAGCSLQFEEAGTFQGSAITFLTTKFPLIDKHGEIWGIGGISTDISERRLAEEELHKHRVHLEVMVKERTEDLDKNQRALMNIVEDLNEKSESLKTANEKLQDLDRLKNIFLASMSHELRTPLNSIIGFTGILLMGMTGNLTEEQKYQLGLVKNSAHHLLGLINDILDISKVEAGMMEPLPEEFSLFELVQKIMESFSLAAAEKSLELVYKVPENLLLYSDQKRIRQIIINLISNAVKFTEHGSVSLIVQASDSKEQPSIRICVSDTGIGIKENDINRLFFPFQQVDESLTKKFEGTGLGLYLSKKLANLLGGDITVKSEYGKGSEFVILLPIRMNKKV